MGEIKTVQSNDKKMTNYRENILQCTKQNTERNQLFVDVKLKASKKKKKKKKKGEKGLHIHLWPKKARIFRQRIKEEIEESMHAFSRKENSLETKDTDCKQGFQGFKVLLSFWPLGARKRSYIRTRHSL